MPSLTVQAALAIALKCVPPSMAPVMVGIAQHESGLNPTAIRRNTNGTLDVGIAQVNTSNFGWTGLTMATAMDPCTNMRAGLKVLFARYNGNPPDTVKASYAADVLARMSAATSSEIPAETPPPPQEQAALDDRPADPHQTTYFGE